MKRRSFFGIILAFFLGKRAVEEAPQAQVRDLETERQKQNAWIRENYANFAGTLVCEGDSIGDLINS